ncbi:isochorismatase family protein [Mycobacterium sp.]|uniref:isochorismatase family protein n=1 Tax=Mycobacterium sp. TaxID=1785 RepID=UPI002CB113BE|nr:isochorismatase family protein [Mycobacterium sp.]HKP42732.1 isochorismatase family protein [Mycobacterium sp.]
MNRQDETGALKQQWFGQRLQPGRRPAVVVIDLMLGFTDPACPLGADLDSVVQATSSLLDSARAHEVPVIFTTVEFSSDGVEGSVWHRKLPALQFLAEGQPWVELDPRMLRKPDEPIIVKRAASAFTGTGLATVLTTLRVDSLIVCGASTSGCVRATAVDACMAGWPTFVPRECVGDRSAAQHQANLIDIDLKYADVISVHDAIGIVNDAPSH